MLRRMILVLVIVVCSVLLISNAQAQLADGMYAVFHTSMGSFTAQLHYAEAPMTVANFVGTGRGNARMDRRRYGLA